MVLLPDSSGKSEIKMMWISMVENGMQSTQFKLRYDSHKIRIGGKISSLLPVFILHAKVVMYRMRVECPILYRKNMNMFPIGI
jgi:hypothetical protein